MKGGRPVTYVPAAALEWRRAVAVACSHHNGVRLFAPVRVDIMFLLPRPKAARKRGGGHRLHHDSRPDIDNLAKAVLDGMGEAGIWGDDAQVTELRASKWFAAVGETPGAIITVLTMRAGAEG
jgi:Holliday junction resolvase RusA-like endonuclease